MKFCRTQKEDLGDLLKGYIHCWEFSRNLLTDPEYQHKIESAH